MLGFLELLTLTPEHVGPDDVRILLKIGISQGAIRDAVYVCYLFCTYDRLADSLGWRIPSTKAFEASARRLFKRGYA